MRWPRFTVVILFAFAFLAKAESSKIMKVLPHFLDLKGHHSVSPSLFDRDAYQKILRENPEKRSGLRFDVQWKALPYDALVLRVEAKGMKGKEPKGVTLERVVQPGIFSQWTPLTLDGEYYENFGELISWRALLLQGTNIVTEQKSFLW